MSLTYRDRLHLAPLARRTKASGAKLLVPDGDDYGIGRSPRFAPGWWLTGAAICYAAIALFCILVL
jgi:hypothetical protein